MQLYHYFMLFGGSLAVILGTIGFLLFLASFATPRSRYDFAFFVIGIIGMVIAVICTGFALFGFIEYLRS